MPQKRNPVLAVLIRRAAATAPLLGSQLHLASAQAVDERPDGAWHTEWQPLALLARHAVTAASQAAELVEGLEVHADAMAATVQRAMPGLLAERAVHPGLDRPTGRGGQSLGLSRRDAVDHRRHAGPGQADWSAAMTLDLTATQLTEPGDGLPLLVVGPSIGTSVTALWSSCAARLAGRFHVVGWDLPGHGRSATTHEPFTMADLAAAVVDASSTGSVLRQAQDTFFGSDTTRAGQGDVPSLCRGFRRRSGRAATLARRAGPDRRGRDHLVRGQDRRRRGMDRTGRSGPRGRYPRPGRGLGAALVRAGIPGARPGDSHRAAAFAAGCGSVRLCGRLRGAGHLRRPGSARRDQAAGARRHRRVRRGHPDQPRPGDRRRRARTAASSPSSRPPTCRRPSNRPRWPIC